MAKRKSPVVVDHWHFIVDSDIINGCGIKDGMLTVSFHKKTKHGFASSGVYQYTTTDLTLCDQMAIAQSKGQFFHHNIRPLQYQRIQ